MVRPPASTLLFMPHCTIKIPSSSKSSSAPNPHAALGVRPCDWEHLATRFQASRIAMDEFPLISDHSVLFQGRGMFGAGFEASMFAADGYAGIANSSSESNAMRMQDERKNKGKDLFFCDLPELGGFNDLETNLRNLDHTFDIGSNYFEDPLWSSICSPYAQLVPSSCFDNINLSNESTTDPVLQSSVSVPDQVNLTHPTTTQQQSMKEGRDTPLSCEGHASSSGGMETFSQHSDAELFCPFDDVASMKQIGGCQGLEDFFCSNQEMLAPTASSTMCTDETVPPSSCSGPDLAAAHVPRSTKKPHDRLNGNPDMILEGMAENPLEIYFPPLTTYEEPEVVMNGTSTQTPHQFPVDSAGNGVLNSAGLQFGSKGTTSAESSEQSSSPLILEAVPVKDLGFQKLQESMNQMDVATKGRIRDALYRLANCVEQKHYATSGAAGSSGSKRFKTGGWTETQTNPMDQSVAQLLLQKPLYRKTVLSHQPCQANRVNHVTPDIICAKKLALL
ncbi:protein LNK1-like [Phragmites australis]|uniref:protein LNK1-like n=1 Tax=Phragmites australis TaxID=29695 RepID=UPI002D7894C2|nr:protein LNK1-like [Phragmites australis]